MALRIVFFGTPVFAARILEALFQTKHQVVAVVSKPDKPKGRQQKLLPTPVKEFLENSSYKNIPFFQPVKASTEEFASCLKSFDADIFLVVAYGEILRQNILDIPKIACVNIHASLLPKYRGAAPIQRSIMNGDKETGITFMHMVLKMDAGDMIEVVKVPIGENENFERVESKLCQAACDHLERVLDSLEKKEAQRVKQDESLVTFAEKILPQDLEINWALSAREIHNKIRGLSPRPGATTYLQVGEEKKLLKIKRTEVVQDRQGVPGQTLELSKGEWVVACGEGALRLMEIQLEGKKSLEFKEFFMGMNTPFRIIT